MNKRLIYLVGGGIVVLLFVHFFVPAPGNIPQNKTPIKNPPSVEELAKEYWLKAKVYSGEKNYEQAILNYQELIKIKPAFNNYQAYHDLADVFYDSGRYSEAILEYSKYLAIFPDNIYARANRANNQYNLDNYQEAKQDYLKVIAVSPEGEVAMLARNSLKLIEEKSNQKLPNVNQQSKPVLTQEEADRINGLEKDWAAVMDNTGQAITNKNFIQAKEFLLKSKGIVVAMEKLLGDKGFEISKLDRIVAIENFTLAYENFIRIVVLADNPRIAEQSVEELKLLFSSTLGYLEIAYNKFYDVPGLQKLCQQLSDAVNQSADKIKKK